MFQKAQKQNLNSNWSIRKALSLKWTSKYFVKKYIELARNHFHISTKIVIFLGNYQGNSLEQTLTNMETHTFNLKKKKKKRNHWLYICIVKKVSKITVPVINGESKTNLFAID